MNDDYDQERKKPLSAYYFLHKWRKFITQPYAGDGFQFDFKIMTFEERNKFEDEWEKLDLKELKPWIRYH